MSEIKKEEVIGLIEGRVIPLFTSRGFHGWSRRGLTLWRASDERIDVAEITFFSLTQCKKWHIPPLSFSVGAGCHFKFAPSVYNGHIRKEGTEAYPQEPQCHLRMKVLRSITQLTCKIPNIWCVKSNGKNLDRVITDVQRVSDQSVVPWFDQFNELETVLDSLIGDPDFAKRYKITLGVPIELPGFIALTLGKRDLALKLLTETLKSDLFSEEYDTVVGLKRQIQKAIEKLS